MGGVNLVAARSLNECYRQLIDIFKVNKTNNALKERRTVVARATVSSPRMPRVDSRHYQERQAVIRGAVPLSHILDHTSEHS
jgi:RAB protein geranylgeranyltransferase component A